MNATMVGDALVVLHAFDDGEWKETVLPPNGCLTEECLNKDCSQKVNVTAGEKPWKLCYEGACDSVVSKPGELLLKPAPETSYV